jgi:hypothetical protein
MNENIEKTLNRRISAFGVPRTDSFCNLHSKILHFQGHNFPLIPGFSRVFPAIPGYFWSGPDT